MMRGKLSRNGLVAEGFETSDRWMYINMLVFSLSLKKKIIEKIKRNRKEYE